jgi:hypothetical protein
MARKIFYSWQATLPNSTNRGFIHTALESACVLVGRDLSVDERPEVDRDTQGVPGAPDIAQTIFAKIDAAHAFVCDVSIVVGAEGEGERCPNPNVLIELGYAIRGLGWDRIILVMNTAAGGPELLPFDLKTKRVTTYEMAVETSERAPERKRLQGVLKTGLELVLQHLIPGPRPDAARAEVLNGLKVVKSEAERMGKHAEQLNTRIQNTGHPQDYFGLHLRPELLVQKVPLIIDHIQANLVLRDNLDLLRSAAAAADEEHSRLMDLPGDWRRLIPLLSNVYFSAPAISREVEQLLKP